MYQPSESMRPGGGVLYRVSHQRSPTVMERVPAPGNQQAQGHSTLIEGGGAGSALNISGRNPFT